MTANAPLSLSIVNVLIAFKMTIRKLLVQQLAGQDRCDIVALAAIPIFGECPGCARDNWLPARELFH